MEKYNVIGDPDELQKFIDWLPVLEPNEKYYLCLFARNKYCKQLTHIKTDKAQLKRFVSDKERMYNKIKQLEIEYGNYTQRDLVVPQEAIALYITVNPRNMYNATVNTMVKLAQSIRDQNVSMNPHQEALSEIQKAKSRTLVVDFDVDDKNLSVEELKIACYRVCGRADITFLETRGGYHVLVHVNTIPAHLKGVWYNNLQTVLKPDQQGDLMIPVPGCFQGGYIPKFV